MLRQVLTILGLLLLGTRGAFCAEPTDPKHAKDLEFFEKDIRPILVAKCQKCHGDENQSGGLRLTRRDLLLKGGDTGPAVTPGKPSESLLVKAIEYHDDDLKMPPAGKLAATEISHLKKWISIGSPWPASTTPLTDDGWDATFRKRLNWWSLQPLRDVAPPAVRNAAWSRNAVDRFLGSTLESAGLTPAAPAEPDVLLRRLSFVLTGLPPSPLLREKFLRYWPIHPETACEQLVDDLLASPHFGEHFARHWMDVVRYTDTYGYESDNPANGAYEYRDYLIRAFNADIPFDQFVCEQLAGDLLPTPRINRQLGLNESAIGPMFFHLGEHREGGSLMFNGIHQQMVDNKIDAFSKAFLAETVACARCHNHKFEAVSQRDYYALAAVFMVPRWTSRVIDVRGKNADAIAKLKLLRDDIRRELTTTWLTELDRKDLWTVEALRQASLTKEPAPAPTKDAKPAADAKTAPPNLEDIARPLAKLLDPRSDPKRDIAKTWSELAAEWKKASTDRVTANAAFKTLTDFEQPTFPAGWVTEGDGLQHGYATDGTPVVALDGDHLVTQLLPRGFHTHSLSSKLPGALRSPPQNSLPGSNFSIRMSGGEYSGWIVVQANGFKSEEIGFLKSPEPIWKTFADPSLKNGVAQVTIEFATTALNPNFPPRIGLAGTLPPNDEGYDKRSWLSITRIVTHDKPGSPQDPLDHLRELYSGDTPSTPDATAQRIRHWLAAPVRRWCQDQTRPDDLPLLNWLLTKNLLPNKTKPGSRLAQLIAEYRRVESTISFPRTVTGMDERDCQRLGYPLNIRGDVDVVGPLVSPDFLQMFSGRNGVAVSNGSGRLELAESLLRPDHPLTSRVYVNRVWQWLFGNGLVATPDDFGHMGDKPSHPELLDSLARQFVRNGWSTKKLIRDLVLTQAFRQSGKTTNLARQRDPGNRLLHHYPTRRLEAEAIRDSLLAVSGRLDGQLYGRPIDPPRTSEDKVNKRLFSGPLDGRGRRSLYLRLSIMEPPRFLVGFNLPDLKLPTGKRDVTNVPTQALTMLNDPLVTELARHWATQLIQQPHTSPDDRIRTMFVTAFARDPQPAELARWQSALRDFATPNHTGLLTDTPAWTRLAHLLFNTKEFIYYR